MNKISIITINFNNAAGLERTIRSVVSQLNVEMDYVVIDGGSTDESADVIKKYAEKINYWVSEADKGIYNAMNKGIARACGEYCLFLNSGDCFYEKSVLSKALNYLDGVDIAYGDIVAVDSSGRKDYRESPSELNAQHFIASTLWHPASFIKKELFGKFGNYNEEYKIVGDYDFFVKAVVKHKVSTKHIPFPVALFDLGGFSNKPEHFKLMWDERKKVQLSLFSPSQIKEAELFEIKTLGRSSKVFYFVPDINFLKRFYDKFYYHWYKWRTS